MWVRVKSLKRWTVYKDSNVLGQFTAQEIRSKLREGVVDPFDLVAEEGSSIQLELVEVDEIFSEGLGGASTRPNTTQMESGPHSTALDKIKIPTSAKNTDLSDIARKAVDSSREGRGDKPENQLRLDITSEVKPEDPIDQEPGQDSITSPKPDGKSENQPKKRRVKSKTYILIDQQKKELGPLSAEEIQSLYMRGILSDSVKVKSQNTGKKVSVRQFLAVYSGKRIKVLSEKAGGEEEVLFEQGPE